MVNSATWWLTVCVLGVCLVTDLRSRRIPNVVVLPYLLMGLLAAGLTRGWAGLEHSFAGLLVGGLFFGVIAWLGGMGMGDVKLCAAIGAWVGPHQMLIALIVTGLAGGVLALGWAVAGGFCGELFGRTGTLLTGFFSRGVRPNPDYMLQTPKVRKMPYAPAIVIGTLVSFFAH